MCPNVKSDLGSLKKFNFQGHFCYQIKFFYVFSLWHNLEKPCNSRVLRDEISNKILVLFSDVKIEKLWFVT